MKKYGIRVTLPEGDVMAMEHLLGSNFESYRWYDSEEERDAALYDMQRHMPNYRPNDFATQVLEKVEQ